MSNKPLICSRSYQFTILIFWLLFLLVLVFILLNKRKLYRQVFIALHRLYQHIKTSKIIFFFLFFLVVRHLRCLRLGNIYKKDNKYQYQYHQSDTNTNRVHNSMPFLSFWWHLVTLNSQLPTNRPCSTSPSQAVCSW